MNTKTLRLRLTGNRTRYRNWLNRRARDRGRAPLPDRIVRKASVLPVYRNRVNPATGRPHSHDKRIGAVQDRALAQHRRREPWETGPDASRSRPAPSARENQKFVRETLAARQPQYAQQVERAAAGVARDLVRRRPASKAGRSR